MKKFYHYSLLLMVMLSGVLASCTYDDVAPGSNIINLAKSPNIVAYSGDMVFGNTFANKGIATRGNQEAPFWNGTEHVKPADVTEDERAYVVQYFHDHQGKTDAVTVDFKNYYVQQVSYEGTFTAKNNGQYSAEQCVNQINTGNNSGDNVFSGNDEFNKCRYIFDSSTLHFWYNNTACGIWIENFKMVFIPGYGYYVGFDVEGKPDGDQDVNTNQHLTGTPDNFYYDRIIKIVPADANGNILDLCEQCGHEAHEDSCDECVEGDGCYDGGSGSGSNNGEQTETTVPEIKNEVEVNLHGVEKGEYGYLESHLSIHVRAVTDVEVFIPVPKDFYCDADDMAILNKHEGDLIVHGGPTTISYLVNGHEVSLNVAFEDDGIRIWTEGICEEVISYCRETYGDGITFEVWNYFNESLELDQLLGYLNLATVEFLDDVPDYYVNAFGNGYDGNGEKTGDKNPYDCTVSIVDEQKEAFDDPETGRHLNDSEWNEIYRNKSLTDEEE